MNDLVEKLLYFLISGSLLIFIGIAWYSIKKWVAKVNEKFDKISEKFDKLIDEFRDVGQIEATQNERLVNINKNMVMMNNRLNTYGERIRKVELTQQGCVNRKIND